MNKNEGKQICIEFYVAGVVHHQIHKVIKQLKSGDYLKLVAEPLNAYDPNAVRIEAITPDEESVMIGYVPKKYSAQVTDLIKGENESPACQILIIEPTAQTYQQLKVKIFVPEVEYPFDEACDDHLVIDEDKLCSDIDSTLDHLIDEDYVDDSNDLDD